MPPTPSRSSRPKLRRRAKRQRFSDMLRFDLTRAGEQGGGARNPSDPLAPSGGQPQPLDRRRQELVGLRNALPLPATGPLSCLGNASTLRFSRLPSLGVEVAPP